MNSSSSSSNIVTPLFIESVISRRFHFTITDLSLDDTTEFHSFVENKVKNELEGNCIDEGFVRPNTIKVITISSGLLNRSQVSYDIIFRCEIFHPVIDSVLSCRAISATRAGIRAISSDDETSPFIAFITREHNLKEKDYSKTEENHIFLASVIAFRFELNDKRVSVIGKLIKKVSTESEIEEVEKISKPISPKPSKKKTKKEIK
jgi:hypothetical protein